MKQQVQILDCTLRDGGYVNDWEFGKEKIANIFERLVSANIDVIEVGFLDERRSFDINRSIQPDSKSFTDNLSKLDKKNSMVVGMIDFGTCPLSNIEDAKNSYLDGIRVIFKKPKKEVALEFCTELIKKGYKVFVQAVSITSYNNKEFEQLMEQVNNINPYAFSIVDTYGLLHKEGLLNYVDIADDKLNKEIHLGYHSHNNFQLAYANCIEMVNYIKSDRKLLVDGSVFGMGKGAGNAPTELLAMYLNDKYDAKYDITQLLEAIDVTILNIFKEKPWGYTMKLFMAASNKCHPNYVTYLLDRQTLSVSSIDTILKSINEQNRLDYNEALIEELYFDFQSNKLIKKEVIDILQNELANKDILLIGPGNSINNQKDLIDLFIDLKKPIIIPINFLPNYKTDYLFLTNSKRYVQISSQISGQENKFKVIAMSNIRKSEGDFDFVLDFGGLIDQEAEFKDNPMIMAIKLLKQINVKSINLAGFDGYTKAITSNYVHPNMNYSFTKEKAIEINVDTVSSIKRNFKDLDLNFITKSLYTLDIKDLLKEE